MTLPHSETPKPRSPGEYIRDELKLRGWTQEDLARVIGRPLPTVNEIIQGKRAVMPEMAIALAQALGIPAEVWVQREAAYRLSLASVAGGDDVQRRAKIYSLAPIKEIQKRGWIRASDNIDVIEHDLLKLFRLTSLDQEFTIPGAARKTNARTPLTSTQRAWAARVRQLASVIPARSVGVYDESKIDSLKASLRKLAAYSSEVKKVPQLLMNYGIRYVVVEGLSGAKVDGWATWLNPESPVIGMSLRYDRLDSFWFTLGHELMHVQHRDESPIDGDVAGLDELPLEVKPPMERRADEGSAAMFVPPAELESFIRSVSPLYSTERINQFANQIKMHPNVIIGQLKHRGEIGHSAHNKTVVPIREIVIKAAITDGWGKSINLGVNP